jgi:succinyl-CoA synthetase beta subunit
VAPQDAPHTARDLGFPVAVKLVSSALAHKSEAGAVRLGLASEKDVEHAVAAMLESAAGLDVHGVLVERMVADPLAEILVSVRHEPAFGQVMVLASGGILVDLVGDAATLLLPTTRDAVAAALGGLKVSSLLGGYRGRPAADLEALVGAILSIAAFADAARDNLADLEINPLIATATGAVAVDALMSVRADHVEKDGSE